MGFLGRIGDDFKYRFMQDLSALDIVFVVLLVAVLLTTLLSGKIAAKFKESKEDILRLSVKIKSVGLFVAAALAIIATQVF